MDDLNPELISERVEMVCADSGGIHPPFEAFYIHSVAYAASRAIQAFDRFRAALSEALPDEEVFSLVQEAMGHAAALSRFFNPSGVGGKGGAPLRRLANARAEKLRAAFEIDEGSVIWNRQLRDALEHFDERLDRYLLRDAVGTFFPNPVVGAAELAEDRWGHIFKLVDPESFQFVILGERFDFKRVYDEVVRVFRLAESMDKNGMRLRSQWV